MPDSAPSAEAHETSINHVPRQKDGPLVFGGGHRAHCSCGWSSDCYAQLSDTQRAIDVHVRRAKRENFDDLLARSSVGQALADVKARGIDAHLSDLEQRIRSPRPKKLSSEDAAFMRGFGAALASIWRCQHDGQLVRQLIVANNFTIASFRGVGILPADLAAIRQALRR